MLGWLLLLIACTQVTQEPVQAPDVLVVVLDTVRADRLATYGHSRDTSYQLSAIAEAGVLFEDVTAPSSWTWPSHASLFTGQPPWVHGAHRALSSEEGIQLPGVPRFLPMRTDLPTLAEKFGAAGYQTAAVSSNLFLEPGLGLTRGFGTVENHAEDPQTLQAALAQLATPTDKPLFLLVNLMSAHAPYRVLESAPFSEQHRSNLQPGGAASRLGLERGGHTTAFIHNTAGDLPIDVALASGRTTLNEAESQAIADLYDGELIRLDHALKTLVHAWNERGGTGVLAVTSDHGESLGERDLLGHGTTVWPEMLRIPLVISAPGRLPAGQRIERPVELADLHNGLLELAGLAPEGSAELLEIHPQKPSIVQAAVWPIPFWEKHVGPAYGGPWQLFREGWSAWVRKGDGTTLTFDLVTDPQMAHDLSAEQPELAKKLRSASKQAFTESASPNTAELALSPQMLQALEALGYVSP